MSTTKTEPLRIHLPNVRLSYPALDKPTSLKQGDGTESKPKFQATFILDKKIHATTIKKIQALMEQAQIAKFGKVQPAAKLKNVCLKDGSEKDSDGYGDAVMSIIAKSDNRPVVVDGQKVPVTPDDAKWPYAGCYVNASIDIFAYKHPVGGMGVSASLRAVQFAKGGEPFSGSKVNLDEEFETVEDTEDALK